jgi:uncharacterized membrane protein
MDATLQELLDLLIRWVHIIAGIMWIGNSLLFNWLDRNLKLDDPPKDSSFGKIWLLHSGAFYEVEKKLLPAGTPYPEKVHWFMFQNLTTWVSGIFLLVVVYYLGGKSYMVDSGIADLSLGVAIAIGVGSLIIPWFVYDLLWRSALARNTLLAFLLSFGLLVALSYALTQLLSGRAAYIHIGAMLGTLMTANVWLYVIPSQRGLVAATKAGLAQDPELSYRAKQRSIHNNYMTFPVLFIMISNHYPTTFANDLNWLILAVLMLGSAIIRHLMNIRFSYGSWLRVALGVGLATIAVLYLLVSLPRGTLSASREVTFSEAQAIINRHCVHCHARNPTDPQFPAPPAGVMFETPEQIAAKAEKIRLQAVQNKAMPLGNKTGMTDEERAILGAWIDQGAKIP